MAEWQPIAEFRYNGDLFLFYAPGRYGMFIDTGYGDHHALQSATHWQPLPDPPQ